MPEIVKKIKAYMRESIDAAPISSTEKTHLEQYSVFLAVGLPTMLAFEVYNMVVGNDLLFAIMLLSIIALIGGWFFLRRISNSRLVYRINTVVFSLLLLYMLVLGGDGGSKILWTYSFPLVSFFLFGKKEGIFWSSGMVLGASVLMVNPMELSFIYAYPTQFIVRFLVSFVIVSVGIFWFEYFRYHYRKKLETKNKALQNALDEVKTLSGFLPICASCKKIRDDQGYWNQIESYIRTHSDAEFSHSICPECAKKLYADLLGDEKISRL